MSDGETILPLILDGLVFEADGETLLGGVSARIEAGAKTFILGPNGSGKSLTLRIAHGLLKPTRGEVRWAGPAASDPGAVRMRQAMVFERPVLLRRSALANVEYGLGLRGVERTERARRARVALERSGLAPLADRAARVLSAGERQRLALARAWALEPEILFLDEPTAALDPSATRAVEGIIEAIAAAGTKVVMTTHDLMQARRIADEILFFHRGMLLEHTPAERFFEQPESADAQAFVRGELVW